MVKGTIIDFLHGISKLKAAQAHQSNHHMREENGDHMIPIDDTDQFRSVHLNRNKV